MKKLSAILLSTALALSVSITPAQAKFSSPVVRAPVMVPRSVPRVTPSVPRVAPSAPRSVAPKAIPAPKAPAYTAPKPSADTSIIPDFLFWSVPFLFLFGDDE